MYVTTVRIPEELAERVKTYCARTGASVNGALLVALERLVAGRPAEAAAYLEGALAGEIEGRRSAEVRPDWRGGRKP